MLDTKVGKIEKKREGEGRRETDIEKERTRKEGERQTEKKESRRRAERDI